MQKDFDKSIGLICASVFEHLKKMEHGGLYYIKKPININYTKVGENMPGNISLSKLKEKVIGNCKKCKLHKNRTNIVFGAGNEKARLVFVGEAPGASEDEQGLPFVGRSGKLLTKMIEAMGFKREEIYICNVIKCRPDENRDPDSDEVESCEPFLKKQLSIINPKVIVALGRYACQCLTQTKLPMGKIRGQWFTYENIPLMPTFHPAYLLRSPSKKKEVWEDLQEVLKKL